ncbi:hypothetical protein NOVOSPHI9U_50493 [Novosphingobium sp. 9U]|nr:hypothetical protein NOVOSPHI9U_50493 [Novosphingobium sp. 9U]
MALHRTQTTRKLFNDLADAHETLVILDYDYHNVWLPRG